MNRPCLRLFHGREEHIQDPVSIARKELVQLAGKISDSGVYTQLMGDAIVQRFFQIMESKVFIHARLQGAGTLHLRVIKS